MLFSRASNDGEMMKLRALIEIVESFAKGSMLAQEFCVAFENAWNFGIEKSAISSDAKMALERLFNEVVLFSPFPRESWGYPKYRDADEVLSAARDALRVIEQNPESAAEISTQSSGHPHDR